MPKTDFQGHVIAAENMNMSQGHPHVERLMPLAHMLVSLFLVGQMLSSEQLADVIACVIVCPELV